MKKFFFLSLVLSLLDVASAISTAIPTKYTLWANLPVNYWIPTGKTVVNLQEGYKFKLTLAHANYFNAICFKDGYTRVISEKHWYERMNLQTDCENEWACLDANGNEITSIERSNDPITVQNQCLTHKCIDPDGQEILPSNYESFTAFERSCRNLDIIESNNRALAEYSDMTDQTHGIVSYDQGETWRCPFGKNHRGCTCGQVVKELREFNVQTSDYTTLETRTTYLQCAENEECIPPLYRQMREINTFGHAGFIKIFDWEQKTSDYKFYSNPQCLKVHNYAIRNCFYTRGLYMNLGTCWCGQKAITNAYCNLGRELASDEPVADCPEQDSKTPLAIFNEFCLCGGWKSRCEYQEYCHTGFQKCSTQPISNNLLGDCVKNGQTKTLSATQLCKCSDDHYCDGTEHCLVDGTCSKVAQPSCSNTTGAVVYTGTVDAPVCVCQGSYGVKKVATLQYCDTKLPINSRMTGSAYPSCKTSGYEKITTIHDNHQKCTCGVKPNGRYDYCSKGTFCVNKRCQSKPQACPQTDGTVVNDIGAGNECSCGSTIADHNQYCNAEMGLADYHQAIPSCTRSVKPQSQICACGATKCVTGQYCNVPHSHCASVPNQRCENENGQNELPCLCGTELCGAAGEYCQKSLNTCSVEPICDNIAGDVPNEQACQCGTQSCGDGEFCNLDLNMCSPTPNAPCVVSSDLLVESCFCSTTNALCLAGKACHEDGCLDTAAECDGTQVCNCDGTKCKAGEFCSPENKCTPYNTTAELTYKVVSSRTCEDVRYYTIEGAAACEAAAQGHYNLSIDVKTYKSQNLAQSEYINSGPDRGYRYWTERIRYPKGCAYIESQEYANSNSLLDGKASCSDTGPDGCYHYSYLQPDGECTRLNPATECPESHASCSLSQKCLCALPTCKDEDVNIHEYRCGCGNKVCDGNIGTYCYTLDENEPKSCYRIPQCTKGTQTSTACFCSENNECAAGEYCKQNGICAAHPECPVGVVDVACSCGTNTCNNNEYCVGGICSPTDTLPDPCADDGSECLCGQQICGSQQACNTNTSSCIDLEPIGDNKYVPSGVMVNGTEYCVSQRYAGYNENLQSCDTSTEQVCKCGDYSTAPGELCIDNKIYTNHI